MDYRFKHKEPVAEGVRRIVDEQIDMAIRQLSDRADDPHDGIHEARKCLKRIRAVLHLLRPTLGSVYSRENAVFRDVGRELSGIRDAEAVLETLDRLHGPLGDSVSEADFALVRDVLVERRDALTPDAANGEDRHRQAIDVLEQVRSRLPEWPLGGGFRAIGAGLEDYYRRARKAFARALDQPVAENYHEWRKRTKDLWYFSQLLQPMKPKRMKAMRRDLKRLSDCLGDDHDLVVFRELLESEEVGIPVHLRVALMEVMEAEQERLRERARELGQRLLAEKPKAFRQRMKQYWKAWRR